MILREVPHREMVCAPRSNDLMVGRICVLGIGNRQWMEAGRGKESMLFREYWRVLNEMDNF